MAVEKVTTNALGLKAILAKLRSHLPELREQYSVTYLGVFGSYVRGEQRKRSDIDILVEFEKVPTIFEFIDLQDELTKLLGLKVDLVSRRALRGEIGKRILAEVVALWRRHPDVPWRKMAGMRDHLAHGYLGVDRGIVWETATRLVPELRPRMAEVLEKESKHD